ncbi:MAG: type II toxin-antitoxin system PemK/MazF family toxin [Candidatus Tectomicrobia bacterium]|uniref:Type II toxin-antitoxin system PemK/MazF family toxin n=1 Tax=Tectimicrobiota bacterium TaxID=2528274 RepID=A0A932GMI5_UNCTE|nr:type II toxin-antitoxin system PemK/MazF family toxin [Candidatus Tectomicrobia bacterium]
MKRGTIVLTPFPFTDLAGTKIRPAIVVSRTDRPGDDVILAFITSVPSSRLLPTDLSLEPSHPDFRATGLKVRSVIKCDKLATVQRRILLGELGALSPPLIRDLDQRLRHALKL